MYLSFLHHIPLLPSFSRKFPSLGYLHVWGLIYIGTKHSLPSSTSPPLCSSSSLLLTFTQNSTLFSGSGAARCESLAARAFGRLAMPDEEEGQIMSVCGAIRGQGEKGVRGCEGERSQLVTLVAAGAATAVPAIAATLAGVRACLKSERQHRVIAATYGLLGAQ